MLRTWCRDEGNRIGKKEKPNCQVFATKAPASPVRTSELEWHISIVLSRSQRSGGEGGFTAYRFQSLDVSCSWGGNVDLSRVVLFGQWYFLEGDSAKTPPAIGRTGYWSWSRDEGWHCRDGTIASLTVSKFQCFFLFKGKDRNVYLIEWSCCLR